MDTFFLPQADGSAQDIPPWPDILSHEKSNPAVKAVPDRGIRVSSLAGPVPKKVLVFNVTCLLWF